MFISAFIIVVLMSLLIITISYFTAIVIAGNKLLYNKKHKRASFTNLNIASEILQLEEVTLANPLEQTLYGWFKRNPHPKLGNYVLLIQHGYKSNRSQMLPQAQFFYEAGFSILLTSVRSHDLCDGTIIHFGLSEVEDVHLWYHYLIQDKGFSPPKIGLVGSSMGGISLLRANMLYGDGTVLILQGVLADMGEAIELAVSHFTRLPGKLFGPGIAQFIEYKTGYQRKMVRPYKWAEKVSTPTFIMHGGADKTLSPNSGEKIFNALQTPPHQKEYWFEPSQGHLEFELYHPEQFKKRIIPFLMKFLVKQ